MINELKEILGEGFFEDVVKEEANKKAKYYKNFKDLFYNIVGEQTEVIKRNININKFEYENNSLIENEKIIYTLTIMDSYLWGRVKEDYDKEKKSVDIVFDYDMVNYLYNKILKRNYQKSILKMQ